ncbi:MAG: hypothetical protein QOH63_3825 [Acidobacteriota bacterium]|nr:hypothetical protein [Acidobacteriota bacterium]
MIAFTKLGAYGRLGNQLFQIASTIGIAIKNETGYLFPKWEASRYYKNPIAQVEIEELLKLDLKLYNAIEHFHYKSVSLDKQYDWDIVGYLQSEKYFQHCGNIVRKHFSLRDECAMYLQSKYRELLQSECCSISVRRGDYLGLKESHPVLTMDYYKRAITQFPEDTNFLVFSDGIAWCKQSFNEKRFFFIEESDPVLALHLISLCRNNIIANSSFSWWGAWLNEHKNKKIIAPSIWFGEGLRHLDTRDLIPEGWIRM